MNIYFAGSITGGRADVDLYAHIIAELSKYGEVLTKHVGNKNITKFGDPLPDKDIYERDLEWLQKADVLVAEVTTPSTGVGYELATIESRGKPVLCLYRELPDRHLSGLIAGNPNFQFEVYEDVAEVGPILQKFFGALKD